jgi:ribosomal protein S18 acetylase RimI-like enzyme
LSKSTYKIRPVRENDWQDLQKLDSELFLKYDQIDERYFNQHVKRPGFFVLTSKAGFFLGYLVLRHDGSDIGNLSRIGVRKSHQSRGFGSILMEFAIDWFRKQKGIKIVQLYTQVDNFHAQGLYQKFGFRIVNYAWHYLVPFSSLHPRGKYSVSPIQQEEIKHVARLFPTSLPPLLIQQFLETKQPVFTQKDQNGHIVGATRFTPTYPGCSPFELHSLDSFDDFVIAFQERCEPKSEELHVTFVGNEKLAKLCEKREYHLHHKLHIMHFRL